MPSKVLWKCDWLDDLRSIMFIKRGGSAVGTISRFANYLLVSN